MKKIFLILNLLLIPVAVKAQNQDMVFKNCTQFSLLAEEVMRARQGGESLSGFIESVHHNEMLTYLAMAAYRKPLFRSEPYKNITISEFRDTAFMACMSRKKL